MLISIEEHSVADFDTQSAYDYDIFNRQINIHLDISHKVIIIKQCYHGISV
jgi:hypothetical protein